MKLKDIINSDLSIVKNKEIIYIHSRVHEWYASSKLYGRKLKLVFIGTGALGSSRVGSSLLIEFEGIRVQIDGEKSEDIQENLDAVLVTDPGAWNAKAAKAAKGVVGTFEHEGLKITPLKVQYVNCEVFGYKIKVEDISIAYIPKMSKWPEWAEDMNLAIVNGFVWDNTNIKENVSNYRPLKLIAEDAQRHKIRQVIATYIGKDTEEALRNKRRIENIDFVSDGSYLVFSATKSFNTNIIDAHSKIFLEFIKRGFHHSTSPKSNLDRDPRAFPEIPQKLFSQLVNVDAKIGDNNIPVDFKLWHNSLHNIWTALRRVKQSILPSKELYGVHDMVAKELSSHLIWDSLDSHWTDIYKNISFSKRSNNLILLYEVMKSFPEKINLVSDAVLCNSNSIFIEKGFRGLLANIIEVKFCRRKNLVAIKNKPENLIYKYNLLLVRDDEDNLNQFRTFPERVVISKSFCYLVGSVVNDGISQNDVDLLLRKGLSDWLFQHIVSNLIIEYGKGNELHIIEDGGLGPQSDFYSLYDLILEREFC